MEGTWLREADPRQRRTFWACFSGWSLDAFDSQLFGLAIPAMLLSFGLTRSQAGLVSGLTIATAAVGGWIGGALSDRIGRVRALQLAVGWFAIGSLAAALAPNPVTFSVLKAVQGFGFGAEWTIGAALISETMLPRHRGRAMGAVQSGWAVGWGAAVLAYSAAMAVWPPALAWRVMFGFGAAPAVLVLVLQRGLEPEASTTRAAAGWAATTLSVFRRGNLRSTLAGSLIGLGAHAGYYGLFTWLPTYLSQERGLKLMASGLSLGVIIVAFGLGCLTSGQLSDRLGRRTTVGLFAAACVALLPAYIFAPLSDALRIVLGFPLGFAAAGIPAALGALFAELYPDGVKGAGVGFCYNAGRVASALAPVVIGVLGEHASLGPLIATVSGGAYSLVVLALFLLPSVPDLIGKPAAEPTR